MKKKNRKWDKEMCDYERLEGGDGEEAADCKKRIEDGKRKCEEVQRKRRVGRRVGGGGDGMSWME
jgi:hypothetical protein